MKGGKSLWYVGSKELWINIIKITGEISGGILYVYLSNYKIR